LHGDNRTLLACTLLCQDLVPRAYCTLYSKVVLYDEDKLIRVLNLSRVSSYLTRTEELSLRDFNEDEDPRHSISMLMTLSGYCPNVKRLSLGFFHFEDWIPSKFNTVLIGLSQFTNLMSLSIYCCEFQNVQQFHRLLYSLPLLVKLDIYRELPIFTRDGAFLPPSSPISRPALQELSLSLSESPDIASILTWLTHTSTVQTLQSLTLELCESEDKPDKALEFCTSVQALIAAVGNNLKYLHLDNQLLGDILPYTNNFNGNDIMCGLGDPQA